VFPELAGNACDERGLRSEAVVELIFFPAL
ncbi:MAG: hypothetical protein QOG21_2482, partial [Actinomycetota bacterium]|nr:hypothetical protein [Actinomycetota bacterium]